MLHQDGPEKTGVKEYQEQMKKREEIALSATSLKNLKQLVENEDNPELISGFVQGRVAGELQQMIDAGGYNEAFVSEMPAWIKKSAQRF